MFNDHYLGAIEERVAADTAAARKKGSKVIGVYCTFTPKELIAAAGAIPVALCAGSEFTIPLAEQHLPRNLCALIKSSYGHALGGTCPYFKACDLILADATCDGKKKMFEMLARLKPLHLLQLPQTAAGDASHHYWLGELVRVKAIIEECTGQAITSARLLAQIKLYNRLRAAVQRVFALNCGEIPLLTGRETDIVTAIGGFECCLETRIAEIDAAVAILRQRGEDPAYRRRVAGRPRILLTGCPTTNKKVLDLIEDSGGIVVAMENCGGMKTAGALIAESGSLLENIANHYLQIACACMSPNPRRLSLLTSLIADYHVDGVIEMTWDGCHTYAVETFQVEECVRTAGVPYLHLTTDYSENDTGQLQTRVEAFLELFT